MAKRDDTREALEALARVADDPFADGASALVRESLGARSGTVVAAAARIVADAELGELADLLAPAFARFLKDPVKRDPGCRAKLAIAEALVKLDRDEPEVFEAGIRHVQMEPVWGGAEDSAAPLRAACAAGLAGQYDARVLVPIAELLADAEREARLGAVRAIVRHGDASAGVPLLRFKLRAGDVEPVVLGECVRALVDLDPAGSLPLAAELLDGDERDAEAVAVALGEARVDGALDLLSERVERAATASARRALLVGIALLRSDEAWEYLIGLVAEGPEPVAVAAATALGAYRHDPVLAERVAGAADTRGSATVSRAVTEAFGLL